MAILLGKSEKMLRRAMDYQASECGMACVDCNHAVMRMQDFVSCLVTLSELVIRDADFRALMSGNKEEVQADPNMLLLCQQTFHDLIERARQEYINQKVTSENRYWYRACARLAASASILEEQCCLSEQQLGGFWDDDGNFYFVLEHNPSLQTPEFSPQHATRGK